MTTKSKVFLEKAISDRAIASFRIKGRWDIYNFVDFLKAIEYIYEYTLRISETSDYLKSKSRLPSEFEGAKALLREQFEILYYNSSIGSFDIFKSMSTRIFFNNESIKGLFEIKLEIKKIQYASPGNIDFSGIWKPLELIKDLIIYYFPNRKDREEAEIMAQESIRVEIENLKSIGLSNLEIQALLSRRNTSYEIIQQFVEADLIENVTLKEED